MLSFGYKCLLTYKIVVSQDILIASVDGLKGFPKAINLVFTDIRVQLCIVHQICNSLKYVDLAYQKQFAKEHKTIYQAFTKEETEFELDKLEEKWGNLSVYFQYPEDIRRVICATNII